MKTDRRSFLRLFGASTAAVATVEGIETVSSPTAPAEFASDVRATRYRHGEAFDVRPHIMYHRIDIEKNSMRVSYQGFSAALGHPLPDGSNADRSVTNMHVPNRLVQPEAFEILKLGVIFSPKTEPGLRSAFLSRYYLEFLVDCKVYSANPLAFMFSMDDGPERQQGLKDGTPFATLPDKGSVSIGEVPLIIIPEVHFHANLYGEPIQPCGKLSFWLIAQGLLARGIQ